MPDFDVIVVGAGPSGLAAATICARAGLNTIVIERGDKPGTKNVMGGILFTQVLPPVLRRSHRRFGPRCSPGR